jgi:hypothetical protein
MARFVGTHSVRFVALGACLAVGALGCAQKPPRSGCGDAAGTHDVPGTRHRHEDGLEHEHPSTPGDRHTHGPLRCSGDPAVDGWSLPKLQ